MKWMTAMILCMMAPAMSAPAQDNSKQRYFEMRTYIAHVGKTEAMHARFQNHTHRLFLKHGMEPIGYWTPASGENADRTLVYILAFPSKEAREASWKAFVSDLEWNQAKSQSEKDGPLVEKIISTPLTPTDYSPIQ